MGPFLGSYNVASVGRYLGIGVAIVCGKTDVVKGRIREAAGALIGGDKLRDEGMAHQTLGKTKQAAKKGVDKVKKTVDKAIG
jgi:uncharacterized protein YjbJ (UPF0337 family)